MKIITKSEQKKIDEITLGKIKCAMIQGMKHVEEGKPRMTEKFFNNACESIMLADNIMIIKK